MSYGEFPVPRRQLEARLVERAWADPDFKSLLIADPRRAISTVFGVELPESMQIDVVEERPDRMVVVLPVDVSGFKRPSVDAMIGRPPAPSPAASPRPPESRQGKG